MATPQKVVFQIQGMIAAGKLDKHLDLILVSIRNREQILRDLRAEENFEKFSIGDKVRLNHIRPKYLSGLEGKIVGQREVKGKDYFVVDLDYSGVKIRRYSTRGLVVPPGAIEPVE